MKKHKRWDKKLITWSGFIASICTILCFGFELFNKPYSITSNINVIKELAFKDNNVNKIDGDNNIIINGDNNIIVKNTPNGIEQNVNDFCSIDESSNQMKQSNSIKNIDQLNFSEAMKYIFKNEKRIKEKKGDLIYSSIYPEVSYYYISDKIAVIEVSNDFRDINYSRTYYYDENEKISFALVFDDQKENRLYFKNDILIRYIDENKNTYDINYNLIDCKWEELVLTESYELLQCVK